jgi:hypothetical protein
MRMPAWVFAAPTLRVGRWLEQGACLSRDLSLDESSEETDAEGFEVSSNSPKKTRVSKIDGALDGAFSTDSNQNLGHILEQLASLRPSQRRALLTLIGGAKSRG